MNMFRCVIALIIVIYFSIAVQAQDVVEPPSIRDIERGANSLLNRRLRDSLSFTAEQPILATESFEIKLLHSVDIVLPAELESFNSDIAGYWEPYIGKGVSSADMDEFKAWLWDSVQRSGYIGSLLLDEVKNGDAQTLKINIYFPKVRYIRILDNGKVSDGYAGYIIKRLADRFKPGSSLDVHALDTALETIVYDLPVFLSASIRPEPDDQVDILIDIQRINIDFGALSTGIVQLNNSGSDAYGREQLLGVFQFSGAKPLSLIGVLTQFSSKSQYLRASYNQPVIGSNSRWGIHAAAFRGAAKFVQLGNDIEQVALTYEYGFEYDKLIAYTRGGGVNFNSQLIRRSAQTDIETDAQSDIRIRERTDDQLRLSIDTSTRFAEGGILITSSGVSAGNLDFKSGDISFGFSDSLIKDGKYFLFHHDGSFQKFFSEGFDWEFKLNWKLQYTDDVLDSQNKLSLGGVSGVRSFAGDEGVVDRGAQLGVNFNHYLTDSTYFGVFYDGAMALSMKKNNQPSYELQALGIAVGGMFRENGIDWNLSIAKSFGSLTEGANAIEGEIGDYKIYGAVTFRF